MNFQIDEMKGNKPMNSTTYPKPWHTEEGRQVVLLSEDFTNDQICLTLADLSAAGSSLGAMKQGTFSFDFKLSASEMDALACAWLEFRESQRQAELAELQRQEEMRQQAFAIAGQYPEIHLLNKNDGKDVAPWWEVSLPGLAVYFVNDAAQNPVSLLSQVKTCRDAWENHQKAEAAHNAEDLRIAEEVKEAGSLAERAGIEIEQQGDGKGYSLYLDNIRYRFNIPARSLLEAVQALSKPVIRLETPDGSIIA